jgi:hypothetical protein
LWCSFRRFAIDGHVIVRITDDLRISEEILRGGWRMKFRFYIVDVGGGGVVGTNKEDIARDYAVSEDYFVVDALEGIWLQSDNEEFEVGEE